MCGGPESLPSFGSRTFHNNGAETTVVETVEQT
jgi:hypothetical protein